MLIHRMQEIGKCCHIYVIVKEKDLRVTIRADMNVSVEQYGIAASKVNQILGLMRRNITYKENR